MHLTIRHLTRYLYEDEVRDSLNEVRLQPLTHDDDQKLLKFELKTDPPARVFHYDLPWGRVHHFGRRELHRTLTIESVSLVKTNLGDPFVRMNLAEDDDGRYDAVMRAAHYEWLLPSARWTRSPRPPAPTPMARRRRTF
jgi:transglutaminase-like putative cysteine protease